MPGRNGFVAPEMIVFWRDHFRSFPATGPEVGHFGSAQARRSPTVVRSSAETTESRFRSARTSWRHRSAITSSRLSKVSGSGVSGSPASAPSTSSSGSASRRSTARSDLAGGSARRRARSARSAAPCRPGERSEWRAPAAGDVHGPAPQDPGAGRRPSPCAATRKCRAPSRFRASRESGFAIGLAVGAVDRCGSCA